MKDLCGKKVHGTKECNADMRRPGRMWTAVTKGCFSQTQLDKGDERLCKRCVADVKRCGKCARNMPSTCYTRCTSQTPSYMKILKKRRCDECLAGFDAGLRSQQRKNMQGWFQDGQFIACHRSCHEDADSGHPAPARGRRKRNAARTGQFIACHR